LVLILQSERERSVVLILRTREKYGKTSNSFLSTEFNEGTLIEQFKTLETDILWWDIHMSSSDIVMKVWPQKLNTVSRGPVCCL